MRWAFLAFVAALALAVLLEGCTVPELHVRWEQAKVRPAAFRAIEDFDADGETALLRVHEDAERAGASLSSRIDEARGAFVGLRLTIPFDLGWDSTTAYKKR